MAMFANGGRKLTRLQRFLPLDRKKYLVSQGSDADDFELPLEKLRYARLPATVPISHIGYEQCMVVKGIRDARVLIRDPAAGNRAMSLSAF